MKRKNLNANLNAIVMLSGGLDSRLACKIMQEQKVKIIALFFVLPFGSGCCNEHCAFNFAQTQGIKLKVIDCTKGKDLQDYMKIIRKPEYGRGTALNPCIDCRIFMLKKAKQFAEENYGKQFIIVTGEVLNERPMSQHKKAMQIIEKQSGLTRKLLRPLSAKLLPETPAEKKGLIDRSKFFSIHGRQRKKQIQLANKFKITYPGPGGGCLLCEKEFAKRLKPLLEENRKLDEYDVQLLKVGRHFENSQIILGRNHQENLLIEKIFKQIKKLKKKGILLVPKQPGPTAFVKNKKMIKKAQLLIQKYSKHKIKEVEVKE